MGAVSALRTASYAALSCTAPSHGIKLSSEIHRLEGGGVDGRTSAQSGEAVAVRAIRNVKWLV